ncbi:MAG: MmgE/PrpD family protein [Rhodoplanes sp.]|uniref:MmgE/PrpD family protein n=1 Tax=Rhodoplanes sp. TaxID=1968906 RepID=UPI001806FA0D|nr:MmgE/PrpD family protein [Rhodoplanes sp.]NVO17571.1 MmgE/PrpD family protein [Rhodoplanes sp.]
MTRASADTTVAQTLGAFVADTGHDDVPPSARAAARRAIVDGIGVGFAGANMPFARMTRDQALAEWRAGRSSLIGVSGVALVAPGAAHVNAVAAHVLDFDANFNVGMVFAPAVLLPAILAAAEEEDAPGADVVTAFAIGTEVVRVLAEALSESPYRKDKDSLFYRGWFNSAVLGPIGAAAACARILRLDSIRASQAIAIAAIQAGGLRIAVGSDMKPGLVGRAAETGVRAAVLAKAGAQAPADAVEGFRGLVQVVNGGQWNAAAFATLGHFADVGTSFKEYPACSSIQAAAEALEHLIDRHAIDRADIVEVRCDVTSHIASNLTFPRPDSVTQAQFSMPFAIACILLHGHFTADLLTEETVRDDAIRSVMGRVTMHKAALFDDDEVSRLATEATRVTLTLRDGRSISHLQAAATGKPTNPISDERLDRKFLRNVGPLLGDGGGRALLARLRGLDSAIRVRELFAEAPMHERLEP